MADQDVDLEDLPPTATLVYKILESADEPLTQPEIAEQTHRPQETVRKALYRLEDAELVDYEYDHSDVRRKVYQTVKWWD